MNSLISGRERRRIPSLSIDKQMLRFSRFLHYLRRSLSVNLIIVALCTYDIQVHHNNENNQSYVVVVGSRSSCPLMTSFASIVQHLGKFRTEHRRRNHTAQLSSGRKCATINIRLMCIVVVVCCNSLFVDERATDRPVEAYSYPSISPSNFIIFRVVPA